VSEFVTVLRSKDSNGICRRRFTAMLIGVRGMMAPPGVISSLLVLDGVATAPQVGSRRCFGLFGVWLALLHDFHHVFGHITNWPQTHR